MTGEHLHTLGYFACLGASAAFLWLWSRRRELLVKPSVQVLFFVHVFIQWPMAFRPELVADMLAFSGDAYLIVHGFVLAGLAVASTTWRGVARDVYLRATGPGARFVDGALPYIVVLLGLCGLAAVIHLRAVPISQLGLFVAFVDPELADQAREESFKLVDSPLVRYGFSLQTSTFAPLSAVLVYGLMDRAVRRRQLAAAILLMGVLAGILVVVSITGARVFAALVLVSIVAAVVIRRGFTVNPLWLALGGLVVIVPPVVLTLLRQGVLDELAMLPEILWLVVGERVFGRPLEIGLMYMQFEQTFGPIGFSGIPRIASLVGVPAVNLPNEIGLMYTSTNLLSVSANAGFLFTFYAYFGPFALPAALAALLSLDLLLKLLATLDRQLLVPALAAMAAAGLSFLSSDFTVSLVSHGYALVPVVAAALVLARRKLLGPEKAVQWPA